MKEKAKNKIDINNNDGIGMSNYNRNKVNEKN